MLVKPAPLTLAGVYKTLRTLALTKGAGSAQRKQALIKHMVARCRYDGTLFSTFNTSQLIFNRSCSMIWISSCELIWSTHPTLHVHPSSDVSQTRSLVGGSAIWLLQGHLPRAHGDAVLREC